MNRPVEGMELPVTSRPTPPEPDPALPRRSVPLGLRLLLGPAIIVAAGPISIVVQWFAPGHVPPAALDPINDACFTLAAFLATWMLLHGSTGALAWAALTAVLTLVALQVGDVLRQIGGW